MTRGGRGWSSLPHERRILLLALAAGLPGVVATSVLLWSGPYAPRTVWTLGGAVAGSWLATAFVLRERVTRPLQTLSNMLAALREGDYSLRARASDGEDALGLALLEVNALGETLRSQRMGTLEATSLVRAVMSEIDVAIYAFDDAELLRLANRAGERLLAQPHERLSGTSAESLGLAAFLHGDSPRVHDHVFPARGGRWEVRRSIFRQDGRPHVLLVITDVTKSLREEELLAWQRLVRVLSHEINNSLAPIKSIAGSLLELESARDSDRATGLSIIASRAESLARLMSSYARLARLPAPTLAPVDLHALVERVARLDSRGPVRVSPGPAVSLAVDRDQIEQALINLIRNAIDATAGTSDAVELSWVVEAMVVEVRVSDTGSGVPETGNLFVPFFTTKPSGTGIGLVLSRQIAEAHGGTLTLANRQGPPGAIARLRLPRRPG